MTGPKIRSRGQCTPGDAFAPDDQVATARITAELRRRRSKPRPELRPTADQSRALAAMRRSLASATEPALRERLEAAIVSLESAYRPPPGAPPQPPAPKPAARAFQPGTATAYAAELLLSANMSYDAIRDRVREKFPRIARGRCKGRPTVLAYRELKRIADRLRQAGHAVPYRQRTEPRNGTGVAHGSEPR